MAESGDRPGKPTSLHQLTVPQTLFFHEMAKQWEIHHEHDCQDTGQCTGCMGFCHFLRYVIYVKTEKVRYLHFFSVCDVRHRGGHSNGPYADSLPLSSHFQGGGGGLGRRGVWGPA